MSDEGDRFRARREIANILEPWFYARTLAEVRRLFEEQRVTWGPYRTVREAIKSDPDCSSDNPMFGMVEQPDWTIRRERLPRLQPCSASTASAACTSAW